MIRSQQQQTNSKNRDNIGVFVGFNDWTVDVGFVKVYDSLGVPTDRPI
jgi:hypothetical protein